MDAPAGTDVGAVASPLARVAPASDAGDEDLAATPKTTAVAATDAARAQRVVRERRSRPLAVWVRGSGMDASRRGIHPAGPGGGGAGRAEWVDAHLTSVVVHFVSIG